MADWIDQSDGNVNTDPNILPYDDAKMWYDSKKGRYILRKTAFKEETGIDLSEKVNGGLGEKSNLLNFYLNDISLKIYNLIYLHAADPDHMRYVLAISPTARDMLYDCFIQQTAYFVTNGDTAQFSGINVRTGQVIKRKDLKLGAISPDVEDILLTTPIPELGGRPVLGLSIC